MNLPKRIAPLTFKFRPRTLAFLIFPARHVTPYAAATSNISVSSHMTSSLPACRDRYSPATRPARQHNPHHRYHLKRQHRR